LILDRTGQHYLMDFIVGAAVCECRYAISSNEPRWQIMATSLFCVGLLMGDLRGSWVASVFGSVAIRGARFWPTLAAAFVVLGASRSNLVDRLFGVRWLVGLGKISFPLYLFHLPLICSVGAETYITLHSYSFSHASSAILAVVASLGASFIVALLSVVALEGTSIRVGRWFESLVNGDAAVAVRRIHQESEFDMTSDNAVH
jgi:peptidoglycan/LPS O-acetylase OafA/YrhL